MMRSPFATLACLTLALTPIACTHDAPTSPDASALHQSATDPSTIVEANDLAPLIASPDARILDVRPQDAFERAHVSGATRIDYDQWQRLSMDVDTGLAQRDAWIDRLADLGIGDDTTVLIYDDGAMTRSARIWFIIQHFGVDDVAIVNGGFPAIERAASDAQITLARGPEQSWRDVTVRRIPRGDASIGLIDRTALRARIDRGDAQVLDVRSDAEYTGATPLNNPRAGHIPGAINIPHTSLLDDNGRLHDPNTLDAIFRAAGVRKGVPIVTHCQGGARAALGALAAQRAGYGPVLNYYLSFGDWSADATCPVVAPE